MGRPTRIFRKSEGGFTLAGLLVAMTVLMIFIAYTVPKQWSLALQRDRERQTIFVMRSYARAIMEWQRRHGGLPTSLDQLKEARSPRLVRGPTGELTDPLTGKVDWILVPPQAVQNNGQMANANQQQQQQPGPRSVWTNPAAQTGTGGPQYTMGNGNNTGTPNPNSATGQAASPRDYKGPFVGVRPAKTGQAYLMLNGSDKYEEWTYTVQDLQNEINARNMAMQNWK